MTRVKIADLSSVNDTNTINLSHEQSRQVVGGGGSSTPLQYSTSTPPPQPHPLAQNTDPSAPYYDPNLEFYNIQP